MGAKPANFGHSADVRIHLTINGNVFPVAQLGPSFITLRDPIEHPPANGEIAMSIDGEIERWNVFLPDGISMLRPNSKIAAPAASKLAG